MNFLENTQSVSCSFNNNLCNGLVHVSIRREIITIVNTFSKNKYRINRQTESSTERILDYSKLLNFNRSLAIINSDESSLTLSLRFSAVSIYHQSPPLGPKQSKTNSKSIRPIVETVIWSKFLLPVFIQIFSSLIRYVVRRKKLFRMYRKTKLSHRTIIHIDHLILYNSELWLQKSI